MILSAICAAPFAMAITQFTKRFDVKPFNCELCMTFWISLFVALLTYSYAIEIITFVGIALFTRQLLWKVWPTMF